MIQTGARAVRVSWREDASARTSLQTEGFADLSDPRLSNPAKMRKKCCYGREVNLGQYSSLSLSPTHLLHTTNITLSRIKFESFIFLERSVFVRWLKLSLQLIMFPYIFVYVQLYVAIQQKNVIVNLF